MRSSEHGTERRLQSDDRMHQAEKDAENNTWEVGEDVAWAMELEKLAIRITRKLYRV
jgi:hypothetical protein